MSVVTHQVSLSARRAATYGQHAIQALLAGFAVGASACAIFAILLTVPAVAARFPGVQLPGWALIPITAVPTFLLGVGFAILVAGARHERAVSWRTLVIGASLPLAGTIGLEFAAHLEPLGTSRSELVLPVFRFAFATASALVAFVCMLVATWTFGIHGSVRRGLEVAMITAVTYLIFAVVLDLVPGFHVGAGDRAMPKVALLCNLIAGIIGGIAAYRRLTSNKDPRHMQTRGI